MNKTKRLRWKRKPKPSGLARVCCGPTGSVLHDGTNEYAWTAYVDNSFGRREGWFWVAPSTKMWSNVNTCDQLVPDEDTAKKQAMEYIKGKMKEQ